MNLRTRASILSLYSTLRCVRDLAQPHRDLCRKAKPPAKGEVSIATVYLWLCLAVNWGGTKSFVGEGRVNGRVRRITLGPGR